MTRTGGVEGEQTVYYRTVNGSAVGGTHLRIRRGRWCSWRARAKRPLPWRRRAPMRRMPTRPPRRTPTPTAHTKCSCTASRAARRWGADDGPAHATCGGGLQGEPQRLHPGGGAAHRYQRQCAVGDRPQRGGDRGVSTGYPTGARTRTRKTQFATSAAGTSPGRYGAAEAYRATASSYLYRANCAHEDEDGYEHAWMGLSVPKARGRRPSCPETIPPPPSR